MNLKLRALEPNDLDIVYETENDESLWIYSNNSSPFSKHTLKKFIENLKPSSIIKTSITY